ncbi:glycosyltransferase [Flavobacterium sp. LS1R49]|uniref:Glycosyltransferase n=1 Tax=Flavobacterium shii TaxID=2987687 RepID=A0A9X3C5W0_9FLAO|nr:glycosyltransferase [Flavobacterium shii]MCV9928332.1 glycosyltransferase [Flavobacterium shii]
MQARKHKIALVGYRLNKGGLEKVMSSLSVYFGQKGIDIHNIVFVDDIGYPYSGTLVNIGRMKLGKNKVFEKLKLFLFFKKYIKENQFDYIIDFRYRIKPFQEYILSKFVYNSKTIYTVHNSWLQTYLPNSKFLTRQICKGKHSVVCVSNGIKMLVEEKFQLQNSVLIYNPIDLDKMKTIANDQIDIKMPYIIAAGRFDSNNVKQFDRLIIAYSNSILPQNDISLVLLGDGELSDAYKEVAIESGVSDKIHILGFKSNPYKYFKNALFLVLCSKYEGFGMTLIEALACETPVISFNCVSGPNEIIINNENGLLVENQNFDKLIDAMNLFVEDTVLYNQCKNNSLRSIERFSIEKIGKQWQDLMGINIY